MTTVVFSADSFWQETKSVANPCKMQVTFWSENVGGWNDFTIEIQVPFHAPNFSMIYGDLFARISFFLHFVRLRIIAFSGHISQLQIGTCYAKSYLSKIILLRLKDAKSQVVKQPEFNTDATFLPTLISHHKVRK